MPNLAISLHAPTDTLRGELVPINRKYGVAETIAACKRFPSEAAQPHHVRVRPAGGRERLARAGPAAGEAAQRGQVEGQHHPAERRRRAFRSSGRRTQAIDRFAKILADRGLTVSVRKSRGRDIRAACGQLIVEGVQRSPGQALAAKAFRIE